MIFFGDVSMEGDIWLGVGGWGQMVDVRVTRRALHHQTITSGDSGEGGGPNAIHLSASLAIPQQEYSCLTLPTAPP